MIKQIILITDGCSNVGVHPAIAAAQAQQQGIVVNVVGIVDYGTIGMLGGNEIEEIAHAGGGISQIVQSHQLSETIQMMTHKTDIERDELLPVHEVDEEELQLRVALLVDASASMKPKLALVEEAVRELMSSLQTRQGRSELSVFHFPGSHGGEEVVQKLDWTVDVSRVKRLFQRLTMRGATPTGPALLKVIDYY